MPDTLEFKLTASVRRLLASAPGGSEIVQSEELSGFLGLLEGYMIRALREVHPAWKHESFDGLIGTSARKSSDLEAGFCGLCILLTDQTVTPFQLQLRIQPVENEIAWLELKVGQQGPKGMIRIGYDSYSAKMGHRDQMDDIEWCYVVGFGERLS